MYSFKVPFRASIITKLPWARLGVDLFMFHRLPQVLILLLFYSEYLSLLIGQSTFTSVTWCRLVEGSFNLLCAMRVSMYTWGLESFKESVALGPRHATH